MIYYDILTSIYQISYICIEKSIYVYYKDIEQRCCQAPRVRSLKNAKVDYATTIIGKERSGAERSRRTACGYGGMRCIVITLW